MLSAPAVLWTCTLGLSVFEAALWVWLLFTSSVFISDLVRLLGTPFHLSLGLHLPPGVAHDRLLKPGDELSPQGIPVSLDNSAHTCPSMQGHRDLGGSDEKMNSWESYLLSCCV